MAIKIAWMKGDGIGPEISEAALRVLEELARKHSISYEVRFYDLGDESLKMRGTPLPSDTVEGIAKADAAIKGPVGESAMDSIVALRQKFDLYANVRPVKSYRNVPHVKDIDLVIVRENTEDLYKGIEFSIGSSAFAIKVISEGGTRRIARFAGQYALRRRKQVTVVHKANVMRVTDGLFRRVSLEELKGLGVQVNERYVDAMAMALVRDPENYDVLLTPNMYGDILSDEAAQVAGGLGFAPSANIGESHSLFEPVHGSAPDIAGKGIANPYSMILAVGMMLSHLGERRGDRALLGASSDLEAAVERAVASGSLTPDVGGSKKTLEVAEDIVMQLRKG